MRSVESKLEGTVERDMPSRGQSLLGHGGRDQVSPEKASLWNKAPKETGTGLGLRVELCLVLICPPAAQVKAHSSHREQQYPQKCLRSTDPSLTARRQTRTPCRGPHAYITFP